MPRLLASHVLFVSGSADELKESRKVYADGLTNISLFAKEQYNWFRDFAEAEGIGSILFFGNNAEWQFYNNFKTRNGDKDRGSGRESKSIFKDVKIIKYRPVSSKIFAPSAR